MVFGFLSKIAGPILSGIGGDLLSSGVKAVTNLAKNAIGGLFGGGGGRSEPARPPVQQDQLMKDTTTQNAPPPQAPAYNYNSTYQVKPGFTYAVGPNVPGYEQINERRRQEHEMDRGDPLGGFARNMFRQFGTDINSWIGRTRLAPVLEGANIGDVFYRGMSKAMDYVRNGLSNGNDKYSMGPGSGVERMTDGPQVFSPSQFLISPGPKYQ